jgi:peptidoglycan/LPS O-acetylase OafA/YrhL
MADGGQTRPRARTAVLVAVVGIALLGWAASFPVVCPLAGGVPCGTSVDRWRTAGVCAAAVVGALALYLVARPRVRPGPPSVTLLAAFVAVVLVAGVVTTGSTGFLPPTF